ncbi:uncharacterized protein LOC135086863 [Ostrinia nubilalis]|uniref:uncharacterized protein LOC135086863 n=1 Tax=Ostrinia nubilalis TaxID=29057 RepID=UPI003082529F
MKCARLNLQERSHSVTRRPPAPEKPQRYCQRRMVNPDHSEDPRWADIFDRYRCTQPQNFNGYMYAYEGDSARPYQDGQDLVLTVQNLKFQGEVQDKKRPRTSFKYKSLSENRRHRMFVKQVVDDIENFEEDRSSELTSYYFDDYVKYILSAERSRPSSSKSSIFLQDLSNKYRENKSIQVDNKSVSDTKKPRKADPKNKIANKQTTFKTDDGNIDQETDMDTKSTHDTKVAYHKSGKRKSLTISRAQSPETIQVIRVDVVCNYSSSSVLSDCEENKRETSTRLTEKDIEKIDFKKPHFADKYLLTNTIKSINENLSCGSKVTLLCKTFKLTDRSKAEKKHSKNVKDGTKSKNKSSK